MAHPMPKSPPADAPGLPRVAAAAATASAAAGSGASRQLLIDDTLSLVNRTGAHFIAKELVAHFGERAVVRRWRSLAAPMPSRLVRKLMARAMLLELRWLGAQPRWRWPEPPNSLRLLLDPLYVLRSELDSADLVLCHDIGPLTHPALYLPETVRWYEAAYACIARRRPGMVFVSETTKAAFTAWFGNDFRLLRSIPLYVRGDADAGALQALPDIGPTFFLSVGAIERRKNHAATIDAFARSRLAARGAQLVLCGARGDASADIERLVAQTPGVVLLGYVSDAQLRWLYRSAVAFVLPSLLEGFGMPALEAAQHGLIPVISGDSALAEAVGGLGIAVDAASPTQIAQAMHDVLALDAPQRADWQQRLRAHAGVATRAHFLQQWDTLVGSELARGAA
jgi:glycosyltransferase involved in cell wall biosynthesis